MVDKELVPMNAVAAPRPVSLVAVVSLLRYGPLKNIPEEAIAMHSGRRWIQLEAVWRSKRRFCLRCSVDDFLQTLQGDPAHFMLHQSGTGVWWVTNV